MIVIDASALIDFLLGRASAHEAVLSILGEDTHEPLHAPQLIEPETLNAFRKLARNGTITDHRSDQAVSDLADLRLIRYPHPPLRERVWELRHHLTAYDATYLALAERITDSILLTGDQALEHRAEMSLGGHRVRHVE